MNDPWTLLGPRLAEVLRGKGYETLTRVQLAVLDPALDGRDLRISSETGSGKTLAIGFVLRHLVAADDEGGPVAFVVTPTRELARQVEFELSWFFAAIGASVASVTGGASYRDERRALAKGPRIVVGTPGRLVDHLTKGGVDASRVKAVVLDEADRMLDMGFTEDLDAILSHVPEGRQTHLVSATFAAEVARLAARAQRDAVRIEGTPLGAANAQIDHVIHLCDPEHHVDALVNLLLATPAGQTLIFGRTRESVADLTDALGDAGFTVAPLSGDMDQKQRNRALSAFRRGDLHALVATDVAARGLDVPDIGLVVHVEPPIDADTYTHRSGRTGRAGKRGTSAILAPRGSLRRARFLLDKARVTYRFEPVPSPAAVHDREDARILSTEGAPSPRARSLAERLVARADAADIVANLVQAALSRLPSEPRDVPVVAPPPADKRPAPSKPRFADRRRERDDAPTRPAPPDARPRPERRDGSPPRSYEQREAPSRDERPARVPRDAAPREQGEMVAFRVTYGANDGADPRRLVAMLCRRGGITSKQLGKIHVGATASVVEVAATAASGFERAVAAPDPMNRGVTVTRAERGARVERAEGLAPTRTFTDAPRPRHAGKLGHTGGAAPLQRRGKPGFKR